MFKGVERLARMSREDREQKIRDLANSVYQAALIAMHVVTEDKDDLVSVVGDFETGGGVNQERVWRIMVDVTRLVCGEATDGFGWSCV